MAKPNALGQMCTHWVAINMRELFDPVVSVFDLMKNAQKLYGNNGIDVRFPNPVCLALNESTYARLHIIDGSCKWDQENDEQTDLFNLAGVSEASGIFAFFVEAIHTDTGGTLNGCAGHKPGRPAVVVGSNCTPWTLAHEVGHVLLGPTFSPVHTTDSTNIMYESSSTFTASSNPSFSDAQITRIMTSRYLRKYD